MVTVYPSGTTIYKPDKCYNGYTAFSYPVQGDPGVWLIDMNGKIVNQWRANSSQIKGGIPRARLLKNGDMLVVKGSMEVKGGGVQEYDWNGKLIWEYIPPNPPHHDIFRKENGNTLIICREKVPEKCRKKARDPRRRNSLYADVILEVTPAEEIVWEWHEDEHLDINRCNGITASSDWWGGPNNNTATDWTHTNTVQALPENRWDDEGDKRFKPGNVLLSLRQLDTILIVDRETKKIVWEDTGDYRGGLSGQHDSHMIEKGLSGAGNIIIFDNGASPQKDLAHAGSSFVLEINPVTKQLIWKYDNRFNFHSTYTSSVQRVPNGNTLINESDGSRIFEVTTKGEIVWEYVYLNAASCRAYRYSYDYCPQMIALGKPKEMPVIPSADTKVFPVELFTIE